MNEHLNPSSYKLFQDSEANSAILDPYMPEFSMLGNILWQMNVIPWIKDGTGYFRTAGNMAIRLKDPQKGFIMTGTEVNKSDLSPHDVIVVHSMNYEKGEITMSGSVKPSREVILADKIFTTFPEANVMIHVHDGVILLNPNIPVTKKVSWAATLSEGNEVIDLMQKNGLHIVNLREHGQILYGNDTKDTLKLLTDVHRESLQYIPSP